MKTPLSGLRLLGSVLLFTLIFPSAVAIAHAQTAPATSRSIHSWVRCDGKTDDDAGVIAAFAAAKNNAFTLVVDCPVFMHIGSDIRRPIYIDNGTTVQFTKNGLFKVDNVQIPAFIIANSTHVRLLGWNVQYVGQLPVQQRLGGYYDNGVFSHDRGYEPSAAFSDRGLTSWLAANRGLHFVQAAAPWAGWTNTSAMFFLVGGVKDLEVLNLRAFVAPQAKGSQFIPMLCSSIPSYNSNQTASHQVPITSQFYSVPNNVTFSDIDIDGYYMGWQGQFQNALFQHIRAHRYGDLQDDNGGNVGGIGKWFAPPHLFYLNYDPKYTGLENRNIRILDVIDYGIRVGVARDKGGSDPGSGYANSLKLGVVDSIVDGYKSYRPDGFLDLMASKNLKIINVDATYDSSFVHDLSPAIRFPQAPYQNVTLANITLADKAAVSKEGPIWSSWSAQNSQVAITNVKVTLNSWAQASGPKGLASVCPGLKGTDVKLDVQFTIGGRVQRCN